MSYPAIAIIQAITPGVLDDPQLVRHLQEKQMYRSLCLHAQKNGGQVVGDWRSITSTIIDHHGGIAWRAELPMEADEAHQNFGR